MADSVDNIRRASLHFATRRIADLMCPGGFPLSSGYAGETATVRCRLAAAGVRYLHVRVTVQASLGYGDSRAIIECRLLRVLNDEGTSRARWYAAEALVNDVCRACAFSITRVRRLKSQAGLQRTAALWRTMAIRAALKKHGGRVDRAPCRVKVGCRVLAPWTIRSAFDAKSVGLPNVAVLAQLVLRELEIDAAMGPALLGLHDATNNLSGPVHVVCRRSGEIQIVLRFVHEAIPIDHEQRLKSELHNPIVSPDDYVRLRAGFPLQMDKRENLHGARSWHRSLRRARPTMLRQQSECRAARHRAVNWSRRCVPAADRIDADHEGLQATRHRGSRVRLTQVDDPDAREHRLDRSRANEFFLRHLAFQNVDVMNHQRCRKWA